MKGLLKKKLSQNPALQHQYENKNTEKNVALIKKIIRK